MRDERVGPVDPVRVARLTPGIARRVARDATRALTGPGECSLVAMHTTCFASERCAGGAGAITPMQLEALCAEPHAYVALADGDASFVGCVTAAPAAPAAADAFPGHAFGPHDLLLSHLCVASAYRGAAVGRRLVAAVLAATPPGARTYLLVDRRGLASDARPDVREVFEARVARLRATYARLSFAPACESRGHLLMCHRPP